MKKTLLAFILGTSTEALALAWTTRFQPTRPLDAPPLLPPDEPSIGPFDDRTTDSPVYLA